MEKWRRKGTVMPLVLMFLVLIHILFFGLLRFCSIEMERADLYTQSYQARIQGMIAKKQLEKMESDTIETSFPKYLQTIMNELLSEQIQKSSVQILMLNNTEKQFGCLDVKNGDKEGICLYWFEVFLPKRMIENYNIWPVDKIQGDLDEKSQKPIEIYDNSFKDQITKIQQEIGQEGFELKDASSRSYCNKWQLEPQKSFEWKSNVGYVEISPTRQEWNINSIIGKQGYRWQTKKPVPKITFLIIAHFEVYEYKQYSDKDLEIVE